jgi:ABC-2 type transport system ATP-binding protein
MQIGLATAEERSFYWRLTAEQNLMFFARLVGLSDSESRHRIIELLEQLEISELATRRFGEMSTGNKQRLALARALLSKPPVLLLDEPTRSLDPLAAARMRNLIRSLAGGDPPVSILLTSHNLPEVEELCERIAIIHDGRIRALGTPEHLRSIHRESERVTITVGGLTRAEAMATLTSDIDGLELLEQLDSVVVAFNRDSHDTSLDSTIRTLHQAGATILDVHVERATLLDVLESYNNKSTEES